MYKKGRGRPRWKIMENVMQIIGCRCYQEMKRTTGNSGIHSKNLIGQVESKLSPF